MSERSHLPEPDHGAPMPVHPAEEATIRAFVISARRGRLLAQLGSAKHRGQATGALNHFPNWDPRYAQVIPSPADVLATLRQAGAPANCHVISDNAAMDGVDMPLAEAAWAANFHAFASVLCCVPGRLACFFDEVNTPRRRILLRRP